MPSNLELFELKQEDLQRYWPFLRRGLDDIKRKIRPNWLPEDIFTVLRAGQVSCVIGRRGTRLLGFQVYSKQQRPFSYEPELFIWAAWNLPLRERQGDDDMRELVLAMWRHVGNVATSNYGTDNIAWMTRYGRAKAFKEKYGWRPAYAAFQVKANEIADGSEKWRLAESLFER